MENTKKSKSLIEKIWWMIPPIFLVFVYWPLIFHITGGEGVRWSVREYFYIVGALFFDFPVGIINSSCMIGFMIIGYWISIQKNLSIKYKIIIPSFFGVIGSFLGGLIAFVLYI